MTDHHRHTENEKFGHFTVFLFESPKSSELGSPDREADLLKAACELSGHRFAAFSAIDTKALKASLEYIFRTWESEKGEEKKPQFALHFSCHGNTKGVRIGKSELTWNELLDLVAGAHKKVSVPYVVTLSSCGGKQLKISKAFTLSRPLYVFSFSSKVYWLDAALTWALLYRKIRVIRVGDFKRVRSLVNDIHRLRLGNLRYHRWDGKKFRFYLGPAR